MEHIALSDPVTADMRLPSDIHIRHLARGSDAENSSMNVLSVDEINRLAGMKSESRRSQFVLGRLVLRSLLGELLNVEPSDVQLTIDEHGRILAPDSGFHVSIAHSGERAVATASERVSAVDLEHMVDKPESLLRYILTEEEYQRIDNLPISFREKLFISWTLKESVLKALGTGLRRSPKRLSVSIDLGTSTAVVSDADGTDWSVSFSISDDYVTAVAYR